MGDIEIEAYRATQGADLGSACYLQVGTANPDPTCAQAPEGLRPAVRMALSHSDIGYQTGT